MPLVVATTVVAALAFSLPPTGQRCRPAVMDLFSERQAQLEMERLQDEAEARLSDGYGQPQQGYWQPQQGYGQPQTQRYMQGDSYDDSGYNGHGFHDLESERVYLMNRLEDEGVGCDPEIFPRLATIEAEIGPENVDELLAYADVEPIRHVVVAAEPRDSIPGYAELESEHDIIMARLDEYGLANALPGDMTRLEEIEAELERLWVMDDMRV